MAPHQQRLLTAALVAAFLAASHLTFPAGGARAHAQVLFVTTLGYGHLIGAAVRPRRLNGGAGRLARSLALVTIATGLVLYTAAVSTWPALVYFWLALSVWHIVENDAAMAGALRAGRSLAPLARSARAQAVSLGLAATIGLAAFAVSHDTGLFADLFSAVTLYHLIGWLVFLRARGTSAARLAALHAPAFALAGLLVVGPAGAEPLLRDWVFSPALYLYWSSLHVAHTIWLRGVAAAPSQTPLVASPGRATR